MRRIFAAKGRPADHPVIVHLYDTAQLAQWARAVPEGARKLAAAFWPGPLTLILPRASRVADIVTGGQDSVGLRVPSHPVARALLAEFGGGIAAPSANRFGRISPTTAQHVADDLGDAVSIDPRRRRVRGRHRIDDRRDSPATSRVLLRPGAIGVADLARVLGRAAACAHSGGAARAGHARRRTTRRKRRPRWSRRTRCTPSSSSSPNATK